MSASTVDPRDPRALAALELGLRPAQQRWRRTRAVAAARAAFARATARAPVISLFALPCAWLARDLAGAPAWLAPIALLLAFAIAVGWSYLRELAAPSRALEIALDCDRVRATHDRLSAALDLAGGAALGDAAHARHEELAALAIEDGVAALERLEASSLAFARSAPPSRWLLASGALLALGLAVHFAPRFSWLEDEAEPDVTRAAREVAREGAGASAARASDAPRAEHAAEAAVPPRSPAPPRDPAARREPDPRNDESPPSAAAAAAGTGGSGAEDEAQRETPRGAPKPSPARASGAGRPGGGSGESSAGAAEAQPEDDRPRPKSERPKPAKETPPKPRRAEDESASSAGTPSGASRGSGRMAPVGNQRQDLQRNADREDDPEVEEEEIEDENEEQQQRGGVMPLTRQDQRTPARELTISGDGPPDQGRGGPTPPKKSRGTASLVLGIRLPDQVRGQPNPGTAKTNLEETPPRRQEAALGPAAPARSGRAASAQRVRPPGAHGAAWITAYHERLRALDLATDPAPAPESPPVAPSTTPEHR